MSLLCLRLPKTHLRQLPTRRQDFKEQERNHNLGKKKRNKKGKLLVYSWREKESKAKTQNRNEEEQSAEKLGEAMWEGRKETCLETI